jgi:ABC-type molybdate transport system ATPase subunit
MIGENYDGRECGTGKNSWIQVVTGQTKPQEHKIILI